MTKRICHRSQMQTEKSQPEGKQIIPETRFTLFPVSQFILPPGQVAPRGASQPWLACPPGGNLSRDILPPTLVTFTPGGQHIPAGLSCPPGVKLNQPGYLAPQGGASCPGGQDKLLHRHYLLTRGWDFSICIEDQ